MNEKLKRERASFDYFIEAYNNLKGTHFTFKEHRDKPDFTAFDSKYDLTVGIETKDLFYDDDEAKILLGHSSKDEHDLMKSTCLIQRLNALIIDAANSAEEYDYKHSMFLVIRVASPIFDKSTFDTFEEDIDIPPNLFSEIWLLFYNPSKQRWGELKSLK